MPLTRCWRLERLFEVGPGLLAPRLLARQDDGAVPVLVALDIELDDIAGLDLGLGARRAEFLEGDAALALQADIDDGEFVGQAEDPAGDDRAVEAGVAAEGLVEEGGEIFALEMILHGSRWRRVRATVADRAMWWFVPLRKAGRIARRSR